MIAKEARASREAMTNTILIGYVHAYVLFDFGASYYFMLSAFIIQHTIPYITVGLGLNNNCGSGLITL